MEIIHRGAYEILLTGKAEGSSRDSGHCTYTTYTSIKQIHKNILIDADDLSIGYQQSITGDALIATSQPIGVHTADCLPIALLGKNYYAVIHGSWKTLQAGILENAVKNLCRQGEEVVDIDVYIGPSIRKDAYEVGPEFYSYFPAQFLEKKKGGITFDMVSYTIHVLENECIDPEKIDIHPACTFTTNDIRWSRRREDKEGRNFMGVRKIGKPQN